MNQQVIYLLGIGRFYPQRENNAAAQNEGQQSQTTLAMQSLLSGTISTQINNVLNSVIKATTGTSGQTYLQATKAGTTLNTKVC